jgi:hypothetical protein
VLLTRAFVVAFPARRDIHHASLPALRLPPAVKFEVVRTVCSAISAAGVLLVLAHVYGIT